MFGVTAGTARSRTALEFRLVFGRVVVSLVLVVTGTVVVVLIVVVLPSVPLPVVVLPVIVSAGSASAVRITSARGIIPAAPPVATPPAIVVPLPGPATISRSRTPVSPSISRISPRASVAVAIALERSLVLVVLALLFVLRASALSVFLRVVVLLLLLLLLHHLIDRCRFVRLVVLLVLYQLGRMYVAHIVRGLILFVINVLHESPDMLELSLLSFLLLFEPFFLYLLKYAKKKYEIPCCTRFIALQALKQYVT